MARSCACDRWLSRAAADLGFLSLPPLAQLLFFRLLAAASGAEERGHIRFHDRVSPSVSRLLNRSETDVETDLAALADLGWLTLDEDDRGVWIAGAKAASARTEAAQINGLRGGRPRKGETKEAARERRQGSLMLPLSGGGAETQETEAEPNGESSRVAAKPIAIEAKPAATREEPAWVSLGAELADIAGLDPARGHWTYQPVRRWLDRGATLELIREVVRRKVETRAPGSGPVRSLQWFDQAIEAAIQRAAPPVLREAAKPLPLERALKDWLANGAQGIPPRAEDVRAAAVA